MLASMKNGSADYNGVEEGGSKREMPHYVGEGGSSQSDETSLVAEASLGGTQLVSFTAISFRRIHGKV